MDLTNVTSCTFDESDITKDAFLSILYQSKEDLELSLEQAINRRFISDIPIFSQSIAAISTAIREAEKPFLNIQDINNIVQTLLSKRIVIADLVFMSKECQAFCNE